MKKLLLVMSFLVMTSAFGSIEFSESDKDVPTTQEINENRACFEDLSKAGCGDPGEEITHFRSCLSNAFPTLTPRCQKMMSDLYGIK